MDSGKSGSLQSSGGGDDSRSGGGGDSSPLSALLRQSGSMPGFGGLLQELATTPLSSPSHGGAPLPQPASVDDQAPPRGSRKRARASRRAPTTVLTTDTSNFRAMVQEFTGIPSPPFAAGTPARARLFPSSPHSAASLRPYLEQKLRPSALPPLDIAGAPPNAACHLLSPAPSSALLGGSYIAFDQSPLGDALGAPPAPAARLQEDPVDFLMSSEPHNQDELSGLVEGCKATPLLERSAVDGTTAAPAATVESWICTSD